MSTHESRSERLLAYYLGNIDEASRTGVEEELLESKVALMNFIALKRSFDRVGSGGVAPSSALKARLAHDVQLSFRKTQVLVSRRSGLEQRWKPVVVVAAALLIVIGGVSAIKAREGMFAGMLGSSAGDQSKAAGISVDAANDVAASLSVL